MVDLVEFGAPALFDLLSDRLKARLRAAASPVTYEDGRLIHARGDVKPGLSVVREGAVRIGNPGADGSYVTTSILGPGQSFGEFTLFADLARTHDAVAVGRTVIDQIDRPRFDRLLEEEPELGRKILVATTRRLHAVLEFLDDLRRLPLTVRTAKTIAMMAQSAQAPGVVDCNQTELAFTLGVSRVSIGKALAELRDEGVIRIGYGRIEIPDLEALHDWIGERTVLAPLEAP